MDLRWAVGGALCAASACAGVSADPPPPAGDDTGGDTAQETWACPEGMVPVGPATAPVYCIDAHEALISGELGDRDQHSGAGVATTATASSRAGVLPSTQITFGQAHRACANTAVTGPSGQVLGHKRLPTSAEWEDGADGVLGTGGTRYPYGDTWSDTACATPTADGQVTLDALQPTGSFPDCVSAVGVYDAAGNAWEWADSGIVMDIDGWLAQAEARGVPIGLGPGDTLLVEEAAADSLLLRMQGLVTRTPERADDGTLVLAPEGFDDSALGITFTGYLVLQADGVDVDTLPVWFDLPVRQSGDEGPVATTPQPVLVLWEAQGATVPDKRGCAWYTGSEVGCATSSRSLDHLHDFLGTISFRCVADPWPVAG